MIIYVMFIWYSTTKKILYTSEDMSKWTVRVHWTLCGSKDIQKTYGSLKKIIKKSKKNKWKYFLKITYFLKKVSKILCNSIPLRKSAIQVTPRSRHFALVSYDMALWPNTPLTPSEKGCQTAPPIALGADIGAPRSNLAPSCSFLAARGGMAAEGAPVIGRNGWLRSWRFCRPPLSTEFSELIGFWTKLNFLCVKLIGILKKQ